MHLKIEWQVMGLMGHIGLTGLICILPSGFRSRWKHTELLEQFHVVEREPRFADLPILEVMDGNS